MLIVEDEATIARNCVTFFEIQGYAVDVAHDGAAVDCPAAERALTLSSSTSACLVSRANACSIPSPPAGTFHAGVDPYRAR